MRKAVLLFVQNIFGQSNGSLCMIALSDVVLYLKGRKKKEKRSKKSLCFEMITSSAIFCVHYAKTSLQWSNYQPKLRHLSSKVTIIQINVTLLKQIDVQVFRATKQKNRERQDHSWLYYHPCYLFTFFAAAQISGKFLSKTITTLICANN